MTQNELLQSLAATEQETTPTTNTQSDPYIYDADTVYTNGQGYRIEGIDAPEMPSVETKAQRLAKARESKIGRFASPATAGEIATMEAYIGTLDKDTSVTKGLGDTAISFDDNEAQPTTIDYGSEYLDGDKKGAYGRTLVDNEEYQNKMVGEGYVLPAFDKTEESDQLLSDAIKGGKGLWGSNPGEMAAVANKRGVNLDDVIYGEMKDYNILRGVGSATLNVGAKVGSLVGEGYESLGELLDVDALKGTGKAIQDAFTTFQKDNTANEITGYSTKDATELQNDISKTIDDEGYLPAIGKALTDVRSLEILATSAPEMVALAASVGTMAIANVNNNINIMEDNLGRTATSEEKAKSAAVSIVGTYLDRFGDKLAVSGMNPVKKVLQNVVNSASSDVKRTLMSTYGKSILRIGEAPLRLTGAGIVEGTTEKLQTLTETAAQNAEVFDKGFTEEQLKESDVAGVLGTAMGVQMATPMVALDTAGAMYDAAEIAKERFDDYAGNLQKENMTKPSVSKQGRRVTFESIGSAGFELEDTPEARKAASEDITGRVADLYGNYKAMREEAPQYKGANYNRLYEEGLEKFQKVNKIESKLGKEVSEFTYTKQVLAKMKAMKDGKEKTSVLKKFREAFKDKEALKRAEFELEKEQLSVLFNTMKERLVEEGVIQKDEDLQTKGTMTEAELKDMNALLDNMRSLGSEAASTYADQVRKVIGKRQKLLGSETVVPPEELKKSMAQVNAEVNDFGFSIGGNSYKSISGHMNDVNEYVNKYGDVPVDELNELPEVKQKMVSVVDELGRFASYRGKRQINPIYKGKDGKLSLRSPKQLIDKADGFIRNTLEEDKNLLKVLKNVRVTDQNRELIGSKVDDAIKKVEKSIADKEKMIELREQATAEAIREMYKLMGLDVDKHANLVAREIKFDVKQKGRYDAEEDVDTTYEYIPTDEEFAGLSDTPPTSTQEDKAEKEAKRIAELGAKWDTWVAAVNSEDKYSKLEKRLQSYVESGDQAAAELAADRLRALRGVKAEYAPKEVRPEDGKLAATQPEIEFEEQVDTQEEPAVQTEKPSNVRIKAYIRDMIGVDKSKEKMFVSAANVATGLEMNSIEDVNNLIEMAETKATEDVLLSAIGMMKGSELEYLKALRDDSDKLQEIHTAEKEKVKAIGTYIDNLQESIDSYTDELDALKDKRKEVQAAIWKHRNDVGRLGNKTKMLASDIVQLKQYQKAIDTKGEVRVGDVVNTKGTTLGKSGLSAIKELYDKVRKGLESVFPALKKLTERGEKLKKLMNMRAKQLNQEEVELASINERIEELYATKKYVTEDLVKPTVEQKAEAAKTKDKTKQKLDTIRREIVKFTGRKKIEDELFGLVKENKSTKQSAGSIVTKLKALVNYNKDC